MNPELEVDTEALRDDAAAVTASASRVTATAASIPATDPAPRWSTTGAAILAADSARRMLNLLGHDTADTAERIRAAATAYEQADDRVAARLRSAR